MEIQPIEKSEPVYNKNNPISQSELYSKKGKKGDSAFQETLTQINLESVVGTEITSGIHHVELSKEAMAEVIAALKKYN